MTNVGRLLRVALPALTALTVATAAPLPAIAGTPGTAHPSGVAAQPTRAAEWWLSTLGVPAAWRSARSKGHGVTVAVLSTGVASSHPDLTGSVTTGPDLSRTGRKPDGPYWGAEGTALASLIAGHGHGAGGTNGITGVAPAARILSVRVTLEYDDPLNADSAVTKRLPGAIAAGIMYAVAHGATVIALPLDPATLGPAGIGDPAVAGGSKAELTAIRYALAHGVLLIAPAGDNGAGTDTVNYPAGYPGVIAVGASDRDGQLTPFTSGRSYVALTAPGSASPPGGAAAGLPVAAPGGYQDLSSTDLAAALTAGVAALIRSQYPWLTVAEVTQALERGAKLPAAAGRKGTGSRAVPGWGHGALSAAAAVTAAAAIAAAHPRPAPHVTAAPRPAPHPTAPRRPARATPVAAHRTDPGSALRSLLVDLVIVAGVLIAALTAALTLARIRRRRRSARSALLTRAGQNRDPGSGQARHSRIPAALPQAASSPATPPLATAWPHVEEQSASARGGTGGSIPIWPSNSFGTGGTIGTGRPRRQAWDPPWPPAVPPGSAALPPVPATAASQHPDPQDALLPPWEQEPGEFAVRPADADQPPWPVSTTGPMYVWNPGVTSGPIPMYVTDEDETEGMSKKDD